VSSKEGLGEFEQFVLLSILRLGDEAYGVPVRREIAKRSGREISVGQLYSALNRLESKGLVRSFVSESTPVRGGRAKKYFTVTRAGVEALKRSRENLAVFWRGVTLPAR
jgi:PadR family transcriptional regulator, regulatory protein PadR